jgi:hypothetical protein
MRSETQALLLRLENMAWFFDAGSPFEGGVDIRRVEDWPMAIEVFCSRISSDARLEASNELTVQLAISHKEAYRPWNIKVAELKPRVERLVAQKLPSSPAWANAQGGFVQSVIGGLHWDLLALCMASEYKDLVSTGYYQLLDYWYEAGHFPCGWLGEVPEDMENAFSVGQLAVM